MRRLYLLMFLVTELAVLGCGGGGSEDDGIARTADFASMSTEELRAVIELSNGGGAATAYIALLGAQLDAAESDNACPTATRNGATLTLAANGCLADSGNGYRGRISATNALTFDDLGVEEPSVDPNKPMKLVFTAFQLVSEDSELAISGTLEQSSPTKTPYDTDTDLAITVDGLRMDEELSITCDARDDENFGCTIAHGVFSIDGLGTFTAEGTFGRDDGDPVGTLVMRGLQELRVTLGAGPCHEFEIGDSGNDRGEICWDE